MKYLSLWAASLLFTSVSLAEQFPTTTLNNQWDKSVSINQETTLVIFASDMDANDIIKASLDELKITNLAERHWVYAADISGMPSVIAKMFALPKMRDYAFPIALDREGDKTATWLKKEEQVTTFTLNNLAITHVKYFADKEAFKQFLSQQGKTTPEITPAEPEPTQTTSQ